jgi:polyphenol oxidase
MHPPSTPPNDPLAPLAAPDPAGPAERPLDGGAVPAAVPAVIPVPWAERFPWLLAGVTTRGDDPDTPVDFRLRGPAPAGPVLEHWDRLATLPGFHAVVHARQLHGPAVRVHRDLPPGLLLAPPCDGHLTREPGVLLTVSLADCVPVFLVAAEPRAVALLHAGWRGTAEGILEAGLLALRDAFGVDAHALHLYLGPSISGDAYEVGPEVKRALGLPAPEGPSLLDLRADLAERAVRAGVPREAILRSRLCTLADPRFHSHRGGDGGRQVGFLGIRGGAHAVPAGPGPEASAASAGRAP